MIARPARHHVEMEMARNARASAFPQIQADVDAFRLKLFAQERATVTQEGHQSTVFSRIQFSNISHMPARRKQQMAIGIGKTIEQHNQKLIAIEEQMRLVVGGIPRRLKDAAVFFVGAALHMFHAPGRPQSVHGRVAPKVCRLARKVSPASRMA